MLTQEQEGIRFSEDNFVRFAPKDTYKFGEHTSESLAQDGFVRASYGFVGAEKLGEVSEKFGNNPVVWTLEISPPEQRVSALDGGGDWLRVSGDFGDHYEGRTFGVLE